jgi:protein phosphatase
MKITLLDPSLVLLVGPSGCGKTTFARRHFKPTEIASSDYYRALISDDENDQSVTREAFELLHAVVAKRLARGKITVVDATNVKAEARRPFITLARRYHLPVIAIVFNLPTEICKERNRMRAERSVPDYVVERQHDDLQASLGEIRREGFHRIYECNGADEAEGAVLERVPLRCDRRAELGPFDIIGDVHGCFDELCALLDRLEYEFIATQPSYAIKHADGRRPIFLGDLITRGPNSLEALKLVMDVVEAGAGLCVPGDREALLARKLRGRNIALPRDLSETLEQLENAPPEFRRRAATFIERLPSHYLLDGGRLVVAHAGLVEQMQGRSSRQVRTFALYGETLGEVDGWTDPHRFGWVVRYTGRALVVYGHTPTPDPEWINNTINLDTGCVLGGKLTALRYPEMEIVQVTAQRIYFAPPSR